MSLKEYERKRDFSKTSEPRAEANSALEGGGFFVQRHDASRLHYDFRLAIDGVLKSWAVPSMPAPGAWAVGVTTINDHRTTPARQPLAFRAPNIIRPPLLLEPSANAAVTQGEVQDCRRGDA